MHVILHFALPFPPENCDVHRHPIPIETVIRGIFAITIRVLTWCLMTIHSHWTNASPMVPRPVPMAGICIQRNGPYESAWDWRVLVLVFCVTLKCDCRQSLCKDSSRTPRLH